MTIRLRQDALLTMGTGFHPVDLVTPDSSQRLPLTSEEAAVAMLLTVGVASASRLPELVQSARGQNVHWDLPTMERFVERLRQAGLLELEVLPDLAEEGFDEGDDPTMIGGPDTVLAAPGYWDDGPTGEMAPPCAEEPDTVLASEALAEATELADPPALLAGSQGPPPVPPRAPPPPVRAAPPVSAAPPASAALSPPAPPSPRPAPAAPVAPSSPRPAPAAPIAPSTPAATGTAPQLAAAAMLVCSGEHQGAQQLLEQLLERDPKNLQALAMLELMGVSRRSPPPRRSRHLGRWIAGAATALALSGVAILILVRVPSSQTIDCATEPIPKAELRAPAGGRVLERPLTRDARPGSLVLVIGTPVDPRRSQALAAQLASEEDLLRIMRTGGNDADVKRQRKEIAETQRELAALPACSVGEAGEACQATRSRLEGALALTRQKLRFCEWQALPKEVAAQEQKLASLRREQATPPPRFEVRAAVAGRLELGPGIVLGAEVARGAVLGTIFEPRRLRVVAPWDGPGGAGLPAMVELDGARIATRVRVSGEGKLSAELERERGGARCRITLEGEKRSLARHLLRRLAGAEGP